MLEQQNQVEKFMGLAQQPIPAEPTCNTKYALRGELIQEELDEYLGACDDGDIVEVADAIADMLYVVLGAAVDHGIPIAPIFEAVHESNMAKFGPGGERKPSGKWQKPPDWEEKHGKPLKQFIAVFLKQKGAVL